MDVAVVTLPAVKMLLVAIMLLGILVEIKTGGMGAGVLLGLVAAAVFWGSQYVEGLVSLYMVAVFFVGILCVGVEMLLPTAGMLAGVGAALMLYSLVLALGDEVLFHRQHLTNVDAIFAEERIVEVHELHLSHSRV